MYAHSFRCLEPYTKSPNPNVVPTPHQKLSAMSSNVISGGIGGFFQGLVLSPLLLLKTRVMTDDIFRGKMTMLNTIKNSTIIGHRVIMNEGITSLMKGSGVFSFKRVMDWSSRYLFSEYFKEVFYTNQGVYKLTIAQNLGISMLGGTASAIVTIPIDV